MTASPQRIERVPGGRRVRLTPVAGAMAEPVADAAANPAAGAESAAAASGPNDERLRREVPPHY